MIEATEAAVVEVGSRDFQRLHSYGQLMTELGLPSHYLDGMKPEAREAAINDVIREIKEKRTDQQIITAEGVTVRLGGKDYEIEPLMYSDDLKFRRALGNMLNGVFSRLDLDENASLNSFIGSIMPVVFSDLLDSLVGLMFTYSKDLRTDKKSIMENTTSHEMVIAATAFFQFIYPFVETLLAQMGDIGGRMMKT